jgi:hypothetical protein
MVALGILTLLFVNQAEAVIDYQELTHKQDSSALYLD